MIPKFSCAVALAVALGAASCAVGAPPGFSAGTQWTFPLVDPLNDGMLVTPVTIKGKGPYLFAIDPEAETSIIDERIVIDAGLRIDRGYRTRLRGDDGVLRGRFNAEVLDLRVGNLAVERRRAIVVPHETLVALGRDIRGVLGRNVIEDSLVFGFDRDRGIAWLQTVPTFVPRAGAQRVEFDRVRAADDHRFGGDGLEMAGEGVDRRGGTMRATGAGVDGHPEDNRPAEVTARADVGGKRLTLDIALGSVASRLRPELWAALGLQPAARSIVEVDATGARRDVPISTTPARVALGPVVNDRVAIGAYVNRDEMASSSMFLDGTLGLDFFAPFSVAADWDARALYLAPRGDTVAQTAARIGRWADLAGCAHLGCVTVSLVEPRAVPAATPTADGYAAPTDTPDASQSPGVLHVARDPGVAIPLEVRLRAVGRTDLPDLVVELPAGVRDVLAPVRGDLAGVRYDVVDAAPFTAPCPHAGDGCVR